MARPKKDNELTYTRQINLRFTDTQYDIVCKASEEAGLSISEYIRRQLIKGKVIAKYEIVADVPELKKLIAEFGKTGSNLNQIARHLNQGGQQTTEILKSIRQCMAEIYTMKYEVVKMAGSFAADAQHTGSSKGHPHGGTETHNS